ncbi:MAG: glycoside hydrolase family 97 protein [Acidobacteriaceae bacterium]|nr:glycoside hydrolase family 97 protein [Acidobacteriaceae bacterium]
MRNRFPALAVSSLIAAACAAAQTPKVSSPDGNLVATFETILANNPAPEGQLVYSVTFHERPIVDRSALALDLQGQRTLGTSVAITGSAPSQTDETYHLITGKASTVRNHYNALRVDVAEKQFPARRFSIEARVYDDAVAFRYVVPEQAPLGDFRLKQEKTEFRVSKDATAYALVLPHYHTMYEAEYIRLPMSAFGGGNGLSQKVLIGLPLLMQVPGVGWMAITEADLEGNSSMYLVNPETSWMRGWFQSQLAPGDDPGIVVNAALPHHSAWRVLLIGQEPGTLVESNVITSLNPECAIKDTSWIHPGLSSWDWWSGSVGPDGKASFSTATMKYYVDFAAKSGFPYMLVDAGWSPMYDILTMNGKVDIPELVRYAAAKNVKVWIWMMAKAVDAQMNEAFPLFEKWGVAGLKIDFVERDDQQGIDWYYRVARLAAAHHLMLDFHGATKPWGIDRTWPNVLGYEAVLGMEQSRANDRDNPDHRVTLPFTRMLAGRMDYTPGGFDNVTASDFTPREPHPMVMGTRAAQLAMYVVYDAPFQMVSDTPKAYLDQPAFDFIQHAPATWDETHVLSGEPGEYITMARRSGDKWFLGSMTNWSPRELNIPLTFLGPGRYMAEIYADAPDAGQYPKSVEIQKKTVDRTTHLKLPLAAGGGYAVRFLPVK